MSSIEYTTIKHPMEKLKLTAVRKTKRTLILDYFPFLFNNVECVNNSSDRKNSSGSYIYLAPPT